MNKSCIKKKYTITGVFDVLKMRSPNASVTCVAQVVGVPRADRGAVREDHLATTGEEWPLRQVSHLH